MQTQSEKENIYVHTPSQRVQKLRQSVTQLVTCIAAKIWCSTFLDLIWGWKDYDISDILSYGTTKTRDSVSSWGYGAKLWKVWATGENW